MELIALARYTQREWPPIGPNTKTYHAPRRMLSLPRAKFSLLHGAQGISAPGLATW